MKNDLRKKWERAYGEMPKSNENYLYNDFGKLRKNSKLRNTLKGMIFVFIFLLILFIKGQVRIYTTSTGTTKLTFSNATVQSNRNGIQMNKSISIIDNYLKSANEELNIANQESISKIEEYKIQFTKLNLSKEYNNYIIQMTSKLDLAEKIITLKINKTESAKINDLIKEYNSIDTITYLAKAFDEAGVTYNLTDDKIFYRYYR